MSKKKAVASRKAALTLFLVGATGVIPITMSPTAVFAAVTGTLSGTVRNDSGQPVPNVLVTLTPGGQRTRTDSQGNYTFAGINPGTYTVTTQLVTFKPQAVPVTVTQDITTTADITLEKLTITGGRRVTINTIQRGQVATQSTISAKLEQETKSQPNNLYQFPGLVFGQPGITTDPSGYTHIRGSDIFQTGFAVDGINVISPLNNEFATNIVTVGLKSANLYTGGADASYGNSTGGFINEVTQNGRDLRGGTVEGTFGPSHGWNYSGTNTQYGNVTPDGKFDYYASTIAFKNNFPGNTQIAKVNSSFDGALKFNYYADPNNQVTGFYSHGFEQYDNYTSSDQQNATGNPSFNLKFADGTPNPSGIGNAIVTNSFQVPHDDQLYDFSYATYKHNFNPQSFLTYRLYNLYNKVTFHEESVNGLYEQFASNTVGNQVDYSNRLSAADSIQAGVQYLHSTTKFHELTGVTGPIAKLPSRGFTDRSSHVTPDQTVLYLTNILRAPQDKATLSLGVRYAQMKYGLSPAQGKGFTDKNVDPRIGATYSPSRDLVFRSSYVVYSQFPETRYLGYLAPENAGSQFSPTAISPAAQLARINGRYSLRNQLGTAHANNVDLGLEKSFNALSGSYAVSVTGYKRNQYDLPQLVYSDFSALGNPFPLSFTSNGTGHASGLEFVLSKKPKNVNDINGFVSYTNQVVRASSSVFDTGYLPYFRNSVSDISLSSADYVNLDRQEFPTSYDQRHTVAVVINKRINKTFEESAFLDAGSGYPFASSAIATGGIGIGADGQHGDVANGTSADFAQVPVTLLNKSTLQAANPTPGRSGWHYKITLNTSVYLTPVTSLFVNVDNIFDRKTVVSYATADQAGATYYAAPSAAYPQGRVYYGPSTIITPIFLSFGFRHRF